MPLSIHSQRYPDSMSDWMLPIASILAFLLIYIVVFAGLQTAVIQFDRDKIDMGQLAERIGRPLCGLFLGYVVTGQLFVATAMAPLPNSYPYPRFSQRNPNPSQPSTPMLNPDAFVVNLFGAISKGGFAEELRHGPRRISEQPLSQPLDDLR